MDSVSGTEFDASRAWLSKRDVFEPFSVTATRPLREAVANGSVSSRLPVLVMEGAGGALALLTHQMTYHHVAQGEMTGQPWMVAF